MKETIVIDGVEYVKKDSVPNKHQILDGFKKRTFDLINNTGYDPYLEEVIRENVWVIFNLS